MLCFVGEEGPRAGEGNGEGEGVTPEVLRVLVPALVMGTKEKNTMVRAASESALLALLRLRQGEQLYQVTGVCM